MDELFIGLMSGTSMDGIDAAIVRFGTGSLEMVATGQYDYPPDLSRALIAARSESRLRSAGDAPELHAAVGRCFRDAALDLLAQSGISAADIEAIGSHGQTLRHEPAASPPFSLQIGDPDIIAAGTGIRTVADFRRADIELGGQGAPLAPAFHQWLFREPGRSRVVVNIGGIANITVLHGDERATAGFDTGPGNTLLDAWSREHLGTPFDKDGKWASSGRVSADLLAAFLADPYFTRPPPKSTGFEYFNLDWVTAAGTEGIDPRDVQATLCELTAASVAEGVRMSAPDATEVLVCGGGIHNLDLMARLDNALPGIKVESTATAGLDPDWVEAAAFAWLAMRALKGLPGNLPSVTGAGRAAVLGVTHLPA